MTLVKFNPDNKKTSIMPGFIDVFDSIFDDRYFDDCHLVAHVPAINISESKNHYHIELAAPGFKKEDFKLNLERDVLSISVKQRTENKQQERNFAKREYKYSNFVRSFTIPESADDNGIQATYNDGVLAITIPKREEAKTISRQIEIK